VQKEGTSELLGISEAARRLALRESTLRSWILKKRIAKVRVGERAIRIPAGEVERIIRDGFVPAMRGELLDK
jgi:excisionase family DNA binding protein